MSDDKRIIEDYLPIEAISAEASREKNIRKGHISTLHLWWARRPLVACRAAVYGALVPASAFDTPGKKGGGRSKAAKFVAELCQYPGSPSALAKAQQHILQAHAERLSNESGKRLTAEDIEAGRAPRPKVLDMFAGGGAIPLEALRLGCDAYALDLNPVAHIIQLCTLVFPQKFGKADKTAPGSATGGTWAGLGGEVRHWGEWVLKEVKREVGDLYPPIPDPDFKGKRGPAKRLFEGGEAVAPGYLQPIAYLWTRTVTCKNPQCRAEVPLVRQTWLCRKPGRFVALRILAPRGKKRVCFEVAEAPSEKKLGFDPSEGSSGGNATCRFCGTVADIDYVRNQGRAGKIDLRMMAVVARGPSKGSTRYINDGAAADAVAPPAHLADRLAAVASRGHIKAPNEPIEANPRSMDTQHFGLERWSDLSTSRQLTLLLALSVAIRAARSSMLESGIDRQRADAVTTMLALAQDRIANYSTTLCVWRSNRTCVLPTFARQALPMVWDFGEMNPFAGSAGDWQESVDYVSAAAESCSHLSPHSRVRRGSALEAGDVGAEAEMDAVVTDPPYYDNVSYSNLSDFFYVWLKRTIGDLYPEHFAGPATPKQQEAIAAAYRHKGSKAESRAFYETAMGKALLNANRALRPGGTLVVVYAHKTTLGWTTLVDALRQSEFQVVEAWPIDTEMAGGMRSDKASLASSIFLVARKRNGTGRGRYEDEVRPELEAIVRERVADLWRLGISGADLVIACVGAGLRAFTRFTRVEYANGEEVPAERFLAEVEAVVLETILDRLSEETGAARGTTLSGVDPATRFYVLWRYTYGAAPLEAGEAIIFANGTHVELDGPHGLSSGSRALVEKKKDKFLLRDFSQRGKDPKLGLPGDDGAPAPLVDVLHRTLWLLDHRPTAIPEYLGEAAPNREQMRLVAQALAGPALKGGELPDVSSGDELSALARLTSNWRSVIEDGSSGRLF